MPEVQPPFTRPKSAALSSTSSRRSSSAQDPVPPGLPVRLPAATSTPQDRELLESAQSKAAGPLKTPSSDLVEHWKSRTTAHVRKAVEQQAKARAAGVDIARSTFVGKCVLLLTTGISVGVAAALTGVTLGAAAPLMVLTGLRMVQVVGDVACARQCWKDAKKAAELGKPVATLPLGADSLGNLIHGAYRWGCKSVGHKFDPATAKHVATASSVFLTCALSASTFFTTLLSSPAPDLIGKGFRWARTFVSVGMLWYDANLLKKVERRDDMGTGAAASFDEVMQSTQDLLGRLQPGEVQALRASIDQIIHQSGVTKDQLRLATKEIDDFKSRLDGLLSSAPVRQRQAEIPATPARPATKSSAPVSQAGSKRVVTTEDERAKALDRRNRGWRSAQRYWFRGLHVTNFFRAIAKISGLLNLKLF